MGFDDPKFFFLTPSLIVPIGNQFYDRTKKAHVKGIFKNIGVGNNIEVGYSHVVEC